MKFLVSLLVAMLVGSSLLSAVNHTDQTGDAIQHKAGTPTAARPGPLGWRPDRNQVFEEHQGVGDSGVQWNRSFGQVDKRMLGATPGAKDIAQVRNMDSVHPTLQTVPPPC